MRRALLCSDLQVAVVVLAATADARAQVRGWEDREYGIGVASLLVALAAFVLGYAQARASARAADRQVQTVEIFTRRLLSADSLRSEVATLRRVVDSLVRTYGKHPSRPRVQTR